MSRVFTNNVADYLEASGVLGSTSAEGTLFGWIKDDNTGAFDRIFVNIGVGSTRRYFGARQTSGRALATISGGGVAEPTEPGLLTGNWDFVAMRRRYDAIGEVYVWEIIVNGTTTALSSGEGDAVISGTGSSIRLGQTGDNNSPAKGKLAHAGVFTRALTDAEITDLASGTNPSSLNATGRYAYYPLTDNSLANAWNADSGVGALTVTGTVANDDADNPTVSDPVFDPAVTLNNATLTPGATLTGTATNFSSQPTTLSLSDGASPAYTPTPTFTANGSDWDFSATIEDFAAQAKAAGEGVPIQGLIPGTITVTVE